MITFVEIEQYVHTLREIAKLHGDVKWAHGCADLIEELWNHVKSFPTCNKHAPTGGTRSGCIICNFEKLSAALSEIDYVITQSPNEFKTSLYDCDCDEERVVRAVKNFVNAPKQPMMKFDPVDGSERPYPSSPIDYRAYHGGTAWLYNPWTGKPRDPRDIGNDVHGYAIVAEEGKPRYASRPAGAAPARQIETFYLPRAWHNCTCDCHRLPGIHHVVPCCRP